jgi:NADPH:quinone reductase-like Zn-dependent oxidoreductase
MKAAVFYRYGGPEVLEMKEIPNPIENENEVLVKVRYSTVNAADWRLRKADPFLVRLAFGLFKPKMHVLGITFSGVVEKVGKNVTLFKPGDRVCGLNDFGKKGFGCHAEYVVLSEKSKIVLVPKEVSDEDAAAVIFGGHTVEYFWNKSKVNQKNQRVLINGASGSVGSTALQYAKDAGMKIFAVSSKKNHALLRELGADEVIDYTVHPIENISEKFDLVIDAVGKTDYKLLAKLVKPSGELMLISGMIKELLFAKKYGKKHGINIIVGTAEANKKDIENLLEMVKAKKLKPVISNIYNLEDISEAHAYAESWRKVGNILLKM